MVFFIFRKWRSILGMIINIKVDGRIERFVIGYVFVITGNLLLNYFKEEEKK